MRLTYQQHVTLHEVTADCKEVVLLAEKTLLDIDAQAAALKVRADSAGVFVTYEKVKDMDILQLAREAVEVAESSVDAVVLIFNSRKMQDSANIKSMRSKVKLSSARLDRTLWDLAISNNDKDIVRALMRKIGVMIHLREDVPAPMRGANYESAEGDVTGLLAFSHAFGYTFIQYKEGKFNKGWSVPLEDMSNAIRVAKSAGINEACKMIA